MKILDTLGKELKVNDVVIMCDIHITMQSFGIIKRISEILKEGNTDWDHTYKYYDVDVDAISS